MKDCLFCKIVKGDIPSHKIYGDENFYVFLDIFPAHKGHLLIIPKEHYENIFDMPQEIADKVMGVGKKMAQAVEKSLNADGYNFLQNNREHSGQVVMHYHLHLIPRYKNEGPDGAEFAVKQKGFKYNPTKEELAETAEQIKQAL